MLTKTTLWDKNTTDGALKVSGASGAGGKNTIMGTTDLPVADVPADGTLMLCNGTPGIGIPPFMP
jgi:hypothetical protein